MHADFAVFAVQLGGRGVAVKALDQGAPALCAEEAHSLLIAGQDFKLPVPDHQGQGRGVHHGEQKLPVIDKMVLEPLAVDGAQQAFPVKARGHVMAEEEVLLHRAGDVKTLDGVCVHKPDALPFLLGLHPLHAYLFPAVMAQADNGFDKVAVMPADVQ